MNGIEPMRGLLLAAGVAVLATVMSGCGFHLAGNRPLPRQLQSVYVELIDPYHVTAPPLQTALQARIARSGGKIRASADTAETVLRVSDLSEGREVLSIDQTGRAIEYRLLTKVTYSLRKSTGEVLIAPESQTVSRDYSFSAQQILPKEAEEARLRSYIQDSLAELILVRIESSLTRSDAAASKTVHAAPSAIPAAAITPLPGGSAPAPDAAPAAVPASPAGTATPPF